MLHVAMYQPVIPQNTGAVARQCVGMNAHLHLIGPMGFEISDHAVKRAGLDYWPFLHLTEYPDETSFFDWLGDRRLWLITKHGEHRFDRADYRDEDVIMVGNENHGIPESIHKRYPNGRVSIPMPGTDLGNVRSYNVSNAAAIVMAHAMARILDGLET